jgi:hypothetical protein
VIEGCDRWQRQLVGGERIVGGDGRREESLSNHAMGKCARCPTGKQRAKHKSFHEILV